MSEPEPEPFMARLLIDSLQHQLAVLTRERDEARADAKRVWDAGTDEHVVGHWRGIAERLAESRDELKHRARGLEKQIVTLTKERDDWEARYIAASDEFQAARDTSYLERAEDAEAKVATLTDALTHLPRYVIEGRYGGLVRAGAHASGEWVRWEDVAAALVAVRGEPR